MNSLPITDIIKVTPSVTAQWVSMKFSMQIVSDRGKQHSFYSGRLHNSYGIVLNECLENAVSS